MESINSKRAALICGGSKGIGRACVELFSVSGYSNIYVFSRSENGLSSIKNVTYIETDLSDKESLRKACERVASETKISVLVNNASGPTIKPAMDCNEDDFLSAFNTQLFPFHRMVQFFLESLKSNSESRIINIVSVTAKQPLENFVVSNTLRGAVVNWAKTLSKELGPMGITVNNVLPGYTLTERLSEVIQKNSDTTGFDRSEIEEKILSQVPLQRFCTPYEVANAVNFLASVQASGINGASIPVDGGWLSCL